MKVKSIESTSIKSQLALLFLFVFFHIISIESVNAIYSFPENEYFILQNFYNSTNGATWRWKNSSMETKWNFDGPNKSNPCLEKWQGLNCTSDCSSSPCFITSIFLDDFNLRGNLSQSLSGLSKLIYLSLNSNNLIGW